MKPWTDSTNKNIEDLQFTHQEILDEFNDRTKDSESNQDWFIQMWMQLSMREVIMKKYKIKLQAKHARKLLKTIGYDYTNDLGSDGYGVMVINES